MMRTFFTSLILFFLLANFSFAQSSSLYATPTTRMEARMPLTLAETSFITREEMPRTFQEQDLITVIYRDQFVNNNQVDTERKRDMKSSYGITKWFSLDAFNLQVNPTDGAGVTIAGEVNSKFKNKGSVKQKETQEFKITCRVTSISQNGILLIEGTNQKVFGEDQTTLEFSGYVRPDDVLPDNTVMSEKVAEVDVTFQPRGNVNDSVRRNWGQKLVDKWSPF